MNSVIQTPTMGEILWEEFMEPMNLSAYGLAHAIHVPVSRIQDIQNDIDLRDLKLIIGEEIAGIRPCETAVLKTI